MMRRDVEYTVEGKEMTGWLATGLSFETPEEAWAAVAARRREHEYRTSYRVVRVITLTMIEREILRRPVEGIETEHV